MNIIVTVKAKTTVPTGSRIGGVGPGLKGYNPRELLAKRNARKAQKHTA